MEDTQIIALYLSRQEAAIGETAKKYGGYINRIAYNILRCREDTEEIAADTYLATWNAIPPEIPRVLKHFLSRIAGIWPLTGWIISQPNAEMCI